MGFWLFFMNLGDRLREERERLGYTQPAFADVAGAKKHAQINWEKGAAFPNAAALEAWSKVGLDVLYVVTGQRAGGVAATAPALSRRAQALVDNYEATDEEGRRFIERAADLEAKSTATGRKKAAYGGQ